MTKLQSYPLTCDYERLRICVVTSTYPRHERDYAVPWLRESIAQLASRGHQITVLAPAYEGLRDHTIDGLQVVRFRYSPKRFERLTHEQGAPNRIRNRWYQLLGAPYVALGRRAARRLARQQPFDIIHAHWPFPHEPIGTVAAKICQAPLVMTAHGAEFALARRKPWIAACLKHSLRKADLLIANSSDTASQIQRLSGCQAEILPFGSTVTPKSTKAIHNSVPRILFTGRLIQRKGVEYLLRAIPLVLQSRPARFVITGDGDQRARLEALRDELQIGGAVEFLGFIDNERLGAEYAQCDLWVNPSIIDDRGDTEGLGVGAIEAYAYGKPVIASAVGGIPDAVVHEKTGILVPEKDPAALAAAICNLLDNPRKANELATAGIEFARERFSWSRITDQLESLYVRSILDGAERICQEGGNARSLHKPASHDRINEMGTAVIKEGNTVLKAVFKTYLRRPLQLTAIGLILGGMTSAMLVCYRQYPLDLLGLHIPSLVVSCGLCGLYFILNAFGWTLVLKSLGQAIDVSVGIQLWIRCEAFRWLPGSIWNFGARAVEVTRLRVPSLVGAASMIGELMFSIIARVLIVTAACGWYAPTLLRCLRQLPSWVIGAATVGLVTAGSALVARRLLAGKLLPAAYVTRAESALSAAKPHKRELFVLPLYYVAICALQGISLKFLIGGLCGECQVPTLALMAINETAWLVGFVAVFAPSGIVVREAVLATALATWLEPTHSIAIAIAWRMLQIAVESMLFVIVLFRSRSSALAPHSVAVPNSNVR